MSSLPLADPAAAPLVGGWLIQPAGDGKSINQLNDVGRL